MADVNKSVEITLRANLKQLEQGLRNIPNMTKKEAQAMTRSLAAEFSKAQKAAKKAAAASQQAAKNTSRSYEKAADDARKSSRKQTRSIQNVINKQNQLSKKTGASFGTIATSAAAAAIAVVALGQRMADLSNQLVDTSTKTGVAVDTLTGLRLAASGAGLSFEELEVGLVRLPQMMLKASQGSKKATRAFESLGVQATHTVNGMTQLRDADEVFNDVITSLNEITSAEERAARAAEIFGKTAGPKFLQSGAIDNLNAFVSLSKEFGQNTGPEMQKEMARFQRVSATATEVMQGEFSRLLDVMAGGEAGGGAGISDIIHGATKGFIVFGEIAGNTIKGLQQSFGAVLAGLNVAVLSVTGTADELERAQIVFNEIGNEIAEHGDKFLDPFGAASARLDRFNELFNKTLQTTEKAGKSNRQSGIAQNIVGSKKAVDELKKATDLLNQMDKDSLKFSQDVIQKRVSLLSAEDQITEKRDIALSKLHQERKALKDNVQTEIERLEALEHTAKREEAIYNLRFALEDRLAEMKKQKSMIIADSFEQQKKLTEEQAEKELALEEQKLKIKLDNESIIAQKRKDTIDDEIKALNIHQQATIGTFRNMTEAASAIMEATGSKNKQLIRAVFQANKIASLGEIAFNTAKAITAAQVYPPPINGLMIASAIAAGAGQTAVVMSQQAPEFHMGGMTPDESIAVVKAGEAVLDRATVDRLGGEPGVNRLQNGQSGSPEVIVMNPYKHFDRYMTDRQRAGLSSRSARRGY